MKRAKRRFFRFSGIRQQLTVKTVGTVCIAFAVCYLITYYYFSHILQQQALSDNISILRQHVQQIEYLNEDVRSLAETLAVGQSVQRTLTNQNLAAAAGRSQRGEELIQLHNAMRDARRTCSSKRYFRRGIMAALDDTGFYWGYSASGYYRQIVDTPEYAAFRQGTETSVFLGPGSEDDLVYLMRVQDITLPQRQLGTIILSMAFDAYRDSMRAAAESFSGYMVLGRRGEVIYSHDLAPAYVRRYVTGTQMRGDICVDETPEGYLLSRRETVSGWQIIAFTDKVNLMQSSRMILPFVLVTLLLTILLCLLLIRPTISRIVRPLEQLTATMQKISTGEVGLEIPERADNEVGVLAETFHQMLQDLDLSMRESMEHEKEQQRLQMELLLAQMNPHFIYNTLNSIVYMARRSGNADIVRLTTSFIKILQDVIPEEEATFTTIGRDVEIVRAYLTIQHYRYTDLFREEIAVAPEVADWSIPRFVIQPLVENAIFHGLNPKGGGGVLTVQADLCGDTAHILVGDNGIGMEKGRVRQLLEGRELGGGRYGTRSIGITNIRARLDGVYGDQYQMNIVSEPGKGAAFELYLPPCGRDQLGSG